MRQPAIRSWTWSASDGKSNHEAGRLLGIRPLTVKNHLQRIYQTLAVSNRAHALARCMSLRLLEALPPLTGLAQRP
jgi:hypothetical protein